MGSSRTLNSASSPGPKRASPDLDDVADGPLQRAEARIVEGDFADGAVAVGNKTAEQLVADAGDLGDGELGQIVVTVAMEAAGVRLLAALAYLHVRARACEHLFHLPEQVRHRGKELLHLSRHILQSEQLPQIVGAARIDVGVVDVQQAATCQRDAGRPKHVGLDAEVGDVFGLDLGGRLHLDQRPCPDVFLHHDVAAHEHAIVVGTRLRRGRGSPRCEDARWSAAPRSGCRWSSSTSTPPGKYSRASAPTA